MQVTHQSPINQHGKSITLSYPVYSFDFVKHKTYYVTLGTMGLYQYSLLLFFFTTAWLLILSFFI